MFALKDDETNSVLGTFAGSRGFFVGADSVGPDLSNDEEGAAVEVFFEVQGFTPPSALASPPRVRGRPEGFLGNIAFQILNVKGVRIGEYFVASARVRSVSEVASAGFSAAISGFMTQLPHHNAERLWEQRAVGSPVESNQWAGLSVSARAAWLEVARMYLPPAGLEVRQDPVIMVDGANVEDPISFFCAIGEAVNGPGGYFGANLDSFEDCMHGGFGISGSATFILRNFRAAIESLSRIPVPLSTRCTYWNAVREIFAATHIDVVIDPLNSATGAL